MDRRNVLSSLVGGISLLLLAGCLDDDTDDERMASDDGGNGGTESDQPENGGTSEDSDENGTDGNNTESNGASEAAGFVLTSHSEEGSTKGPVSYSGTVVGGGYDSAAGPLTISIELENVADSTIEYGERRSALFEGIHSESGTFALYPGRWNVIDEGTYELEEGCWHRTTEYVFTADYQIGTLEPGESHENTLVLTADRETDCPDTVPEEITFQTSTIVDESEGDESLPSVEDGEHHEWGFTLHQQ